jgi:predicted DNA-binding protein with PD1-like motif
MQDGSQHHGQQAGSMACCYAFRLTPGEDLVMGIRGYVSALKLRAVAIVTCVGSLTMAKIRFANAESWTEMHGHFEILSLVGTVDVSREHLHVALADGDGHCVGGHIGLGCIVYTTAEFVIAELTELEFERTPCPLSGYEELHVKARGKEPR